MPLTDVNGTKIYYEDQGSGNPLLFIHGLGATHRMFEPQRKTFSKTHRVIIPDIRGNGQSGRLTSPIHTVLSGKGEMSCTWNRWGCDEHWYPLYAESHGCTPECKA